MNRSTFALLIALLVHTIFLLLFLLLGSMAPEIKKPEKEENKIKISLKEMPIKEKESGLTKKQIKQTDIAPPMPKGSQLEKIVKKPNIKFEPKEETKQVQPTQINSKPKEDIKEEVSEQLKVEELPSKDKYITLSEPEEKEKEDKEDKEDKPENPLYALLSQDKSSQEVVKKKRVSSDPSSINQDIKELYGEEFGELTPGQQEYILDNQEIMRRITQQILTRVASVNLPRDLNVNKNNVIEFYLHPNGDMTDFRFIKTSGYYILDDTTKETIEYAYSRYPRPSEKTLIRYNVFYNLARY